MKRAGHVLSKIRMYTGLSVNVLKEINNLKYLGAELSIILKWVKVFYLSTDAQENCCKKTIKIYFQTAPICFGAIAIIRERPIRAC